MSSTTHRRRGPRPGRPDTRTEILRAAREEFAVGYGAATLRGVARRAGVDPALIVQFFGGKDGLFHAALVDIAKPRESLAHIVASAGGDGVGEQIASYFLGLWESSDTRPALQAMLMSAAARPEAADMLRRFVTVELIGPVAVFAPGPTAQLRAALAGTQLIGAAFGRYVVAIPELVQLPVERYTRIVGRSVDAYLHAPLPRARRARIGPGRTLTAGPSVGER